MAPVCVCVSLGGQGSQSEDQQGFLWLRIDPGVTAHTGAEDWSAHSCSAVRGLAYIWLLA